jgi:hypothetical protein
MSAEFGQITRHVGREVNEPKSGATERNLRTGDRTYLMVLRMMELHDLS